MESAHGSVATMIERTRAAGEDSVFDRMLAQGERRCQFCEQGIRCSLCSQGPCRITAKAPRGVCGIDADGMAMRNFLLQNTMGTATYTFHATEVFKTLAQAKPGGTYEVKDWSKLEVLAKATGLDAAPKDTLPARLAAALTAELSRDRNDPSPLVKAFAPKPRLDAWQQARHHARRRPAREHVRDLQLPHQRRRRLRLAGPQGPASGHRHRLRRAGAARVRAGRSVRHAAAARREGRPGHHRRRLREHRRQRS